jgi:hypothetical protein
MIAVVEAIGDTHGLSLTRIVDVPKFRKTLKELKAD